MITAREKGRNLEIIVGGGDEAITFLITPVKASVGSQLLASWVGVAFGETTDDAAHEAVDDMAKTVLGPVFDEIEELRWAEQEGVFNAAFLWNVRGGGIDLVNEYLTDGLPKARETLLKASGLWQAWVLASDPSQWPTSPPSESENPTSTDDSPDTSIPDGGVNSTP